MALPILRRGEVRRTPCGIGQHWSYRKRWSIPLTDVHAGQHLLVCLVKFRDASMRMRRTKQEIGCRSAIAAQRPPKPPGYAPTTNEQGEPKNDASDDTDKSAGWSPTQVIREP